MTVTIDFKGGLYSGVALGQHFSKPLALISEQANVVVFRSGDAIIACQFQKDDTILLTKEGGIPILLERST